MTAKIRSSGLPINHKKIQRIYYEMGLQRKIKPKKRIPSRSAISLAVPNRPNVCWSIDFMSDTLISGKKFRAFNVIDDFNREVLWIATDTSMPADRVIRVLDQVAAIHGYPEKIRSDNGPEFISHKIHDWALKHSISWLFIQPGKPAQNAYIERFNRTFREDVLDAYLFNSISEIQDMAFDWMHMYNSDRPHESLGNLSPHHFALSASTGS